MRLKHICEAPFFIACLLMINGCHPVVQPPSVASPTSPYGALAPIQSPSGKTYTRTHVGPADDDEPVIAPARPGGDEYLGSSRMAAKLAIVSAPLESFDSLAALLDSLPSDESMRALQIDKGPNSGRLAQEQRLVAVSGFIYASSKESDNDFHCVVGGDPNDATRFMNVEVSALPPSTSEFVAALRSARLEFKAFFTNGSDALPTSGYEKYTPPIPVKIVGSIFFDVDHIPPAVGPTGMKPQTAWEIHPVSHITFEP